MSTSTYRCRPVPCHEFKTHEVEKSWTNSVLHLYVPDTLFDFLRRESLQRNEISRNYPAARIFLEGSVTTAPTSCVDPHGTIICSISGVKVSSARIPAGDEFPSERTRTRRSPRLFYGDMKKVLEDPNLIGEVLVGDSTPSPGMDSGSSRVWVSLRVEDVLGTDEYRKKSAFAVENYRMDDGRIVTRPGARSVVWMHFDPRELKYLHLQHLDTTGLPQIVVDGFSTAGSGEREEDGWESMSLLRGKLVEGDDLDEQELVPFDQSKYLGGYEEGYFETNDDQQNFWKIGSAGFSQLLYKFYLFKGLLLGKYRVNLCLFNLLAILVLDMIMGYYLTVYLLKFPSLYTILHTKVGELLELLLRLLNWLRGSPAGLKLNAELNSLLWRFFSYHLHLWRNYIGILEPILSTLLSTIIHAGILGLSVQIALIQDLLSIATFHVYCLYIYASRLFSVQQIIVVSLGRLFMGRKWNPLRNRIDHVNLSKSEMFLGALAFTIGIFLVPTTLVYYVVFLSLRLPVLVLESILAYFVTILNTCRIATNYLIVSNSPRVCDEIYLEPIHTTPDLNPNSIPMFQIRVQNTKSIWRFPKLGQIVNKLMRDICKGKVLN